MFGKLLQIIDCSPVGWFSSLLAKCNGLGAIPTWRGLLALGNFLLNDPDVTNQIEADIEAVYANVLDFQTLATLEADIVSAYNQANPAPVTANP